MTPSRVERRAANALSASPLRHPTKKEKPLIINLLFAAYFRPYVADRLADSALCFNKLNQIMPLFYKTVDKQPPFALITSHQRFK
jgi:hypothetical protein